MQTIVTSLKELNLAMSHVSSNVIEAILQESYIKHSDAYEKTGYCRIIINDVDVFFWIGGGRDGECHVVVLGCEVKMPQEDYQICYDKLRQVTKKEVQNVLKDYDVELERLTSEKIAYESKHKALLDKQG